MDPMHGSMFVPAVDVYQGNLDDCRGAAVVVITAGAKQKPGQTHLDLAAVNAKIPTGLLPSVLKVAPAALVLIVSNPVDVLTYIAGKISPLAPARVIGSPTRNSLRFATPPPR
jgi:L-lactate dehydrogenase